MLSRGLEDSEIQMDLLGDRNQDMMLEQILRFIEGKEAGKRSASRLLLLQAIEAVAGRTQCLNHSVRSHQWVASKLPVRPISSMIIKFTKEWLWRQSKLQPYVRQQISI